VLKSVSVHLQTSTFSEVSGTHVLPLATYPALQVKPQVPFVHVAVPFAGALQTFPPQGSPGTHVLPLATYPPLQLNPQVPSA
jgi:hypothetical protein